MSKVTISPSAVYDDGTNVQPSRAGGDALFDTVRGSTSSGGSLTLTSTSHATKGGVLIGTIAKFDEVVGSLTIGGTTDWGYDARVNVLGLGASNYRGLAFADNTTDTTSKGASALVGPRYTIANEPFAVIGNYDTGSYRGVYIGGGAWSIPDATVVNIYAVSSYTESNGVSGNLRLAISSGVASLRNNCKLGSSAAIGLAPNTLANGQSINIDSKTELTTIAAAATTDTTITMPAGAVILAVTVRTTVVIPTATSYSVGDSGVATRFNTANVGVAANSTDAGTKAGAYYNASALAVRLTMNGGVPAANTGRVRVTILYYTVTPPTS